MPIKPENKKLYPKNWKEIRAKILERADNKCEFCGVANHSYIIKSGNITIICGNKKREKDVDHLAKITGGKKVKIVLTIAHLDHNPQNNNPDNLRALCQKCHNNYDKEHRKQTRAKTLEQKKKEQQQ